MVTEYSPEFYETVRAGAKASAEAVVPRFLEHYRPGSVVDVGCGEGWWGKAFEDAGCPEVLGLDGEYAEPVIPWQEVDLTTYGVNVGNFDLAISLEVAEHLPPEAADNFVQTLCELAPVVLFSAAIPGQGGTGHLNEQWPAYWVERFEANNFAVTGNFRMEIWNDDRVENWYRQNLLVATRIAHQFPPLPLWDFTDPVLPLVHPVLYDARRS